MSRLRTIAFAMKNRLEEVPELKGKVVVFRRADIESQFETRMGKTRGRCVVIRLIRGKNTSPNKLKARFAGTYTVTLFTVPLLTQKDGEDADDLMQAIIDQLHGWWPDNVPSNGTIWCNTDSLTFPEDPAYDIASLLVEAPRTSN